MKTLLLFLVISISGVQLYAQQITISGSISDEQGLPLPGVNVLIEGTSNGTQTDFDGNYAISAAIGQTLVFSYVGYTNTRKKITTKNEISFSMVLDAAGLQEVVVTAYGRKRKKRALSAAVTTNSSQSISRKKRKFNRSLQGKAAGVNITGVSENPGSSPRITIRGAASINNGTPPSNESYATIKENTFKRAEGTPLSTFSIDVDKASYSNIRRMINKGQKIPSDAVKIEEMINYFNYDYPEPKADDPFSIHTEVATSPWNKDAQLLRIGLKGKSIATEKAPASNLVFLLDVSGSMGDENKLPLLKAALQILLDQLREKDKVSIVVYAGAAGVALEPTFGTNKEVIMKAINDLSAGGSTAGGEGIKLAYKIAEAHFIKNGNNRVILATDGDFNVGMSSDKAMEKLIEKKRANNIFLTCLGFGMGNYKDAKLETLADKGNGNHYYIDTMQEARRVLGTEFFGTIYTIAKDVKIQVEFNPAKVQAYRLVGYENRLLLDEDFQDDTKDAGELGSGHTVTALYEVIPEGVKSVFVKPVPDLKYTETNAKMNTNELATIKFRYKNPKENESQLISHIVENTNTTFENASDDFKYASSIALFGMQLRNSLYCNKASKKDVIRLAESGKGADPEGYRAEFIRLVKSY